MEPGPAVRQSSCRMPLLSPAWPMCMLIILVALLASRAALLAVLPAQVGEGQASFQYLYWSAICTAGHEAVVQTLLGAGAGVDIQDGEGGTALQYAAYKGDWVSRRACRFGGSVGFQGCFACCTAGAGV